MNWSTGAGGNSPSRDLDATSLTIQISPAARFLADGGLWQQWSDSAKTPAELRELIRQLCSAADEAMNTG